MVYPHVIILSRISLKTSSLQALISVKNASVPNSNADSEIALRAGIVLSATFYEPDKGIEIMALVQQILAG